MNKPKIHTSIGHDRALCGMNPNRGHHTVVSNSKFAAAAANDRCGKCAKLYRQHGYSLPAPEHKASPRRATAAYYRQQQ